MDNDELCWIHIEIPACANSIKHINHVLRTASTSLVHLKSKCSQCRLNNKYATGFTRSLDRSTAFDTNAKSQCCSNAHDQ